MTETIRHETCHCIVCTKVMQNIATDDGFQPSGGLCFMTYGHYGSHIFDPMDGSTFLEVVICDDCVKHARETGDVIDRKRFPRGLTA